MQDIVYSDMKNVITNLGDLIQKFENAKILITGHTGFLGTNYCALFHLLNKEYLSQKADVSCIDSRIVDLEDMTSEFTEGFRVIVGDAVNDLPSYDFDYVIHCAGIASPTYYRKFPLETIRVNAISFWEMLELLDKSSLKGFLYFSTSEIYGNPDPGYVPTGEDYNGNVSCTGPRACYDESKRLGETIATSFVKEKNMPIHIVRPFNVYGLFMRLHDRRVIPDFVKSALETKAIEMLSDGTPTRAFCYISDALEGFLRVLLLGQPGRAYNIGNDSTEISMLKLAELIAELMDDDVEVERHISEEKDYLTDNPQRRCPNIQRARTEIDYAPKVDIKDGVKKTLEWYKENYKLEK